MKDQEIKSITNKTTLLIAVIALLLVGKIYNTVNKVEKTVNEIESLVMIKAEEIATEGKDYIVKEYSDDAKALVNESVDSLSNRIRGIIKLPNRED